MRAQIFLTSFIASFLFLAAPSHAAEEPPGIAMETYNYPYPVKFFPLKIEGQDVRMAYMDVAPTNKPNAPVVVLFHGKNFFGAYWKDTIDFLANVGFRVIVPDQIGFGKSSRPNIHYSFFLLSKNTRDLLDSLGIKRVSIVGHSMGGMVATRFALMYPDFTTQLILENPIGLEDYSEKAPYAPFEALYEKELTATEDSIRKYHQTYYVEWKPRYEEYVQVQAQATKAGQFHRLAWPAALTSQMIYEQPVCHEFPLVKPPTLLIIGQADRTAIGKERATPEKAATMGNYPVLGRETAKQIPNAKLVEIEKCGHIPHFEAPEAFHAALLEFLKSKP